MGIFSREKSPDPVALEPYKIQQQEQLQKSALPVAQRALGQYGQPLPFDLTTQYEQQGLQTLGDYLGSTPFTESPLFQGAQSELEKTFGGEYDPVGGQYYQGFRTAVMRELEEAKDRLARRTSAGDQFFGGGRIQTEGELEETAMGNLTMALGQLFEGERDRRLQAVPLATGLLGAGEAGTLGRVAASQQYGGLEFQRQMGDYLRKMEELGIPLETALALATTKNEFYTPSYEPSAFERIGLPILQAGALAVGGAGWPGFGSTTGEQGYRPGIFRG